MSSWPGPEAQEPTWTPIRLRETLLRHLHGERVILVANREPYIHEQIGRQVVVRRPASGLVTALEPVMRACSGVWIAHGSGSADRAVTDVNNRVLVPPHQPSYVLRRVWLTADQERGYYYGMANEGLWATCHIAHTKPAFRVQDWRHYEAVNRLFADAVVDEVSSDDPIVLVQDYHFALLPSMLRRRLPNATVLTFWHIPWPNAERFGICPWRDEILEGLLGSSILGFHTQGHCNHFIDAVDQYLEARIDRERHGVVLGGRPTFVRAYPISVEWPSQWSDDTPPAAACRVAVRQQLGLPADVQIGLGVDRLDYTKGIEERLLAVARLFERYPGMRNRFTFVQLAAPSRSAIEEYRLVAERVERIACEVNGRFASGSWRPIVLRQAHHEPAEIFRFYRAVDVCYVSSLHDGMNLVAKEFVSARDDEQGVLILSRFTGAASELTEALTVNPYDLEEASAALQTALTMSLEEQQIRMRALRAHVSHFNVYRWAGHMLIEAARHKQYQRLTAQLREHQDTVSLP